jgi:hypothetical protein
MTKPIYGGMAEFDNPSAHVNAARAAREKAIGNSMPIRHSPSRS